MNDFVAVAAAVVVVVEVVQEAKVLPSIPDVGRRGPDRRQPKSDCSKRANSRRTSCPNEVDECRKLRKGGGRTENKIENDKKFKQ